MSAQLNRNVQLTKTKWSSGFPIRRKTKRCLNRTFAEIAEIEGTCFVMQGMHKEAIAKFSEAMSHQKKRASAYVLRAASCLALMDRDAALSDVQKSVKFDSLDKNLYLLRADLFYKLGKYADTVRDCLKLLLELDKDNRDAAHLLANAYEHLQKPDDAKAARKAFDNAHPDKWKV